MKSFRQLSFCILLPLLWGVQTSFPGTVIPDTGRVSMHQRLLDLVGRFRVLSISVRPGCEDAPLLAYLRFGRGARIISAYATNGETGENDHEFEYPSALASTRRREAEDYMSMLDGEAQFLNMPDLAAASSKARVFEEWDKDSLRTRLLRLMSVTKPDLIVLGQDRFSPGNDSLVEILREEVSYSVKELSQWSPGLARAGILEPWQVQRVAVASSEKAIVPFPVQSVHPLLRRTFKDIGDEVDRSYRSLEIQQQHWSSIASGYSLVRTRSAEKIKWLDDGFPVRPSRTLAPLAGRIQKLASLEAELWRMPRTYVKNVASLLDSIDAVLARRYDLSSRERRDLVNWRGGLESLRVLLLGVQLRYTISENILTDRQLVFFTIDSLSGHKESGRTEIYFPAVEKGWILNEAATSKLPLRVHESYRLVSPAKVDFDLPFSEYGMNKSTYGTVLHVFVIHLAEKREENFVYRITCRILFAPRFVCEVLTPIVRIVPGEHVVFRMTNNSRDGVADSVTVRDSLASSVAVLVRLNTKGSAVTDTIPLSWERRAPEGTFVVPIEFGGVPVAVVGARQFEVNVDTGLQVGILSQYRAGPMEDALRRLGMKHVRRVSVTSFEENQLQGLRVVVVDRRSLTFATDLAKLCASLTNYVQSGGRVVVLSQDAQVWNRSSFTDLLHLQSDNSFESETPVAFDSTDNFARSPNHLLTMDFAGWIVRRASNRVVLESQAHPQILVRTGPGNIPHVASFARGSGQLTYVDLSLERQLVNINPGAFRILANLLAR